MNSIEQSIKRKIESNGIPLKDWGVSINYGVKTGFNDAFIISSSKKDELINADPRSAEIIRPILRGRDIKRYQYTFADLWLIATFPSKNYNIDDYPAVRDFLLTFGRERLEQTGKLYMINGVGVKARKKTNNKWFETQDSISYWDDFSKQKIVWGEISDKPKFSIDINGEYSPEATTFLMVGEHLKYLLCVLNSSLSEYFFAKYGTTTGMGTLRWKKYLIELLPIPEVDFQNERNLEGDLDLLLASDDDETRSRQIEKINNTVYQIFGLTEEEVEFIEESNAKGSH